MGHKIALVLVLIISFLNDSGQKSMTSSQNHREKRSFMSLFRFGVGFMNFFTGDATVFGTLGKCWNQVMIQKEADVVIRFLSDIFRGTGEFSLVGSSLDDASRSRLLDLLQNARNLCDIFFTCYTDEVNKIPRSVYQNKNTGSNLFPNIDFWTPPTPTSEAEE